ncbi:hypothetical protein [Streptomyces sp. NBC_00268]|nr:hypothetical protein [Streptomyces sp. NBC_00268]MCX5182599.1 hypothetical protein [Streptomyces sp. NBC_00268]
MHGIIESVISGAATIIGAAVAAFITTRRKKSGKDARRGDVT